jgi:hypothetical protein
MEGEGGGEKSCGHAQHTIAVVICCFSLCFQFAVMAIQKEGSEVNPHLARVLLLKARQMMAKVSTQCSQRGQISSASWGD